MLEFKQSEKTAVRRRLMFHLVDVTDGITPLTGQTGTGFISKNGATPVATTNSMVEVSAGDTPGLYYIEFTEGELDTLGFLGFRVKTAASAEFQDRALITYDDPFAFHGGFPIGAGKAGSQQINWKKVMDMMRQVIKEEMPEVEKTEIKIPDYSQDFADIKQVMNDMVDADDETHGEFDEVKAQIAALQPKDYGKEFSGISSQLSDLAKVLPTLDIPGFSKAVSDFQAKMGVASEELNGSLDEVKAIKEGFSSLQELMKQFEATLSEQGDMDKRFDKLSQAANNKKIEELSKSINDLQSYLMQAMKILTKVR